MENETKRMLAMGERMELDGVETIAMEKSTSPCLAVIRG